MEDPGKTYLIIQMGGTIDKDYPRTKGGYHFEIGVPAVERLFSKFNPGLNLKYKVKTVCRKDSQNIAHHDRELLLQTIAESKQEKVLVTHGTDGIIETAQFLQKALSKKKLHRLVVLTGSFQPERFKDTDADFNVGLALGALQSLPHPDVDTKYLSYVAMNGLVIPACKSIRKDDGSFASKCVTHFS